MIRNNSQIWRIAKWLYDNVPKYEMYYPWKTEEQSGKDRWYDKALELQRKIMNNEFTGEDSHAD